MNRTRLGILTLCSQTEDKAEYDFFRRLSEQGDKMDMGVIVLSPADVQDGTARVTGLLHDGNSGKWRHVVQPLPPLIFDRCRYQHTPLFGKMKSFRRRYESKLTFLNHTLAHKWPLHCILMKHTGIASFLPETAAYEGVRQLQMFMSRFPIVYLKPSDGTGGRGIVSLRTESDGILLMQGRSRNRQILGPARVKPAEAAGTLKAWGISGEKYLIQQGIPITLKNGRVHDFRLLIQKDGSGCWEVTGCAGRIGPPRSVTSNLHGGGSAVSMRKLMQLRFSSDAMILGIEQSMERLAFDVADVLEKRFGRLCELALDIAVDPDERIWLLEVNPKPSREVFRRIGETDVYRTAIRRPLEYARHLAGISANFPSAESLPWSILQDE